METFLECPICRERFKSEVVVPMLLQCGHTVCKSCLILMYSSTSCLRCPFDRSTDSRKITEIKANYSVLHMAELHPPQETDKVYCIQHCCPIALYCKTCNDPVCPKCIRMHTSHDMYDLENEEIMKELYENIQQLEEKLYYYQNLNKIAKKRVDKEIEEEKLNKEMQIRRIESYFNDLYYILDKRKREFIAKFEKKNIELYNSLMSKSKHLGEAENYYDIHVRDVDSIKNVFHDKKRQDRVVLCNQRLKEYKYMKYSNPGTDFDTLPIRLSVEFQPIPIDLVADTMHIQQESPIKKLKEIFYKEKSELSLKLEMRITNVPEQMLVLNVLSTSSFLYLNYEDERLCWSHLLDRCCRESLGIELSQLPEKTRKELISELGLVEYDQDEALTLLPTLRSKLRSFICSKFATVKWNEDDWDSALSVLNYTILKESDTHYAEQILKVALIYLCAKSYRLAIDHKVMETLPYLDKVRMYVKRHFSKVDLIFQQVMKYMKSIYDYVEMDCPECLFPFFQQRCSMYIRDLEANSTEEIPTQIPQQLEEELAAVDHFELQFWRGDKMTNAFFEDVKKIRGRYKHIFKAVSILYNRRSMLNSAELCRIQQSI